MQPARRSRFSRRGRLPRRGSLTVEMVLVVVVLAIVTVGVVQFGVFFANAQMVALAARVGGLEASQTPNLPPFDGAAVPEDVLRAIEHQLASSCIEWCRVRLEHNVTPSGNVVVLLASPDDLIESLPGFSPAALSHAGLLAAAAEAEDDCNCPAHDPLPNPPFPDTQYVRLTVCVPLNEVFPTQLSYFGAQLFGPEKTYEHTVTLRYELTSP